MQAGIAIDGIAQAANDLSFANFLALFYGAVYGLISRPYPVCMGDGNDRFSCHRADKRDNAIFSGYHRRTHGKGHVYTAVAGTPLLFGSFKPAQNPRRVWLTRGRINVGRGRRAAPRG